MSIYEVFMISIEEGTGEFFQEVEKLPCCFEFMRGVHESLLW